MPLSVRVDRRTAALLKRLARQQGRTKSDVVRKALSTMARHAEESEKARHPWETVEDLIGCVTGGPPDLSVKTGQGFRRMLHEKRRQ
jgi:predicted DNA-binding protein